MSKRDKKKPADRNRERKKTTFSKKGGKRNLLKGKEKKKPTVKAEKKNFLKEKEGKLRKKIGIKND